jgi:hypothetical protein
MKTSYKDVTKPSIHETRVTYHQSHDAAGGGLVLGVCVVVVEGPRRRGREIVERFSKLKMNPTSALINFIATITVLSISATALIAKS